MPPESKNDRDEIKTKDKVADRNYTRMLTGDEEEYVPLLYPGWNNTVSLESAWNQPGISLASGGEPELLTDFMVAFSF